MRILKTLIICLCVWYLLQFLGWEWLSWDTYFLYITIATPIVIISSQLDILNNNLKEIKENLK